MRRENKKAEASSASRHGHDSSTLTDLIISHLTLISVSVFSSPSALPIRTWYGSGIMVQESSARSHVASQSSTFLRLYQLTDRQGRPLTLLMTM